MRKLKLQVQITVDGFVAGPDGAMDWMTFSWDEELKNYVTGLTAPVDTIVLGRKLAEGFIPHWAAVAADENNEEQEAGKKFTDTAKIVFSKTLQQSLWPNTALATNLVEEISELKRGPGGGDIIAYGGARFVSSLIAAGLVDEFYLFVNPVAIGTGLPIFNTIGQKQKLALITAKAFGCGIALLHYNRVD